jgi:hypothetical protein
MAVVGFLTYIKAEQGGGSVENLSTKGKGEICYTLFITGPSIAEFGLGNTD